MTADTSTSSPEGIVSVPPGAPRPEQGPPVAVSRRLPTVWPTRLRGEDLESWGGRALRSYDPNAEADEREARRLEAEREAHLARAYDHDLHRLFGG